MASRRWNAFSVCTRPSRFVAAAGDQSAVPLYPSVSSQVLSTGGTSLILSGAGVRISETAWYGGGGDRVSFSHSPAQELMEGIREKQEECAVRRMSALCRPGLRRCHLSQRIDFRRFRMGQGRRHQLCCPCLGGDSGWNTSAGRNVEPAGSVPSGRRKPVSGTTAIFYRHRAGGKPPVPGSEGLGSVHRSGFPPSKPAAGWSGRNKRSAVTFFSDPA